MNLFTILLLGIGVSALSLTGLGFSCISGVREPLVHPVRHLGHCRHSRRRASGRSRFYPGSLVALLCAASHLGRVVAARPLPRGQDVVKHGVPVRHQGSDELPVRVPEERHFAIGL